MDPTRGPLGVGQIRISGLQGEASVKARQVFLQGAISFFNCDNPCPAKHLHQAILKRAEEAFQPAPACGERERMSFVRDQVRLPGAPIGWWDIFIGL